MDVLVYNKQTGLSEQRDRISLDSDYEKHTTLQELLTRMADFLALYESAAEQGYCQDKDTLKFLSFRKYGHKNIHRIRNSILMIVPQTA